MARDPRLPPPLPLETVANPYAAPSAIVADVAPGRSEAEAVREAHVRHERQLKGIGALYYLFTLAGLFTTVAILIAPTRSGGGTVTIGFGAFYAALTLASAATGYGYRTLRPWVKVPGGILSSLGLLAFPVGTLINAWVLYATFGPKGQVVLAPTYDAIVAATPNIRFRYTTTEKIVLAVLGAILLGVLAMIVIAVGSR